MDPRDTDRAARHAAAIDALRAHLAEPPTESEERRREHARRHEEACAVLRAGLAAAKAAKATKGDPA